MYYCENCKKNVPENEVKQLLQKKFHFTEKMVNFYTQGGKHQSSGKVGFDPVTEKRFCGLVIEIE